MVKPNVLTHVIGDYVIQEANEPFPLTRQRYPDDAADEPPSKYPFIVPSFDIELKKLIDIRGILISKIRMHLLQATPFD